MITLYGIEFPEDEVQVFYVNGEPEWVVNIAGARRLAEHSPDPALRDAFLKYAAELEARYE